MRTRVDTNAQIFWNQRPTTGASLTGVPGVDFHHATTSAFRLVRRVVDQLTPSSIGYALGETVVLEHPVNIQVLKRNDAKLVDQPPTEFVGKISAAVGDALVYLGDHAPPPGSFGRSLLGFAQLPLGFRQNLLILAEETRIRDMLARTEGGERVKPYVNTNGLWFIGQRLGFNFTSEAGVPVASSSTANGERLDLALDRTVENNLHAANLGQGEAVVFQLEAELGVGEAVIPRGRPEARIPWRLASLDATKEVLKGKVNAVANLLQHLGVNCLERGPFLLPAREHFNRVVEPDVLLTLLPGDFTNLKRLVVDPTAFVKLLLHEPRLSLCWVQSVLE